MFKPLPPPPPPRPPPRLLLLPPAADIYEAKWAVIQMAKFVLKSLGGKFDILNHNICSGQMHTCGKGAHVVTEKNR